MLTGFVDSMVPNSGPWSLLRQSVSYIIKLAPILWWALPTGSAAPHPELFNASTYDWLPEKLCPSPITTPAQAAHQPTNQYDNLDLEQLPAKSQPAPYRQSGFSSPSPVP
ncbi:hypothetical protein DSO57_1013707 [Entomophthora muscae]|uniref:Uncharacterized protein n=1 Tax=Entomophthora muscae TaxID=34485 RepID=A0ACC2TGM9_9FUNG|nr:hypothetical protein DSO57_1013707 [Entomophthora muscae]